MCAKPHMHTVRVNVAKSNWNIKAHSPLFIVNPTFMDNIPNSWPHKIQWVTPHCQLPSLLDLLRDQNPCAKLYVQICTPIKSQKIEFAIIGLADTLVVWQSFWETHILIRALTLLFVFFNLEYVWNIQSSILYVKTRGNLLFLWAAVCKILSCTCAHSSMVCFFLFVLFLIYSYCQYSSIPWRAFSICTFCGTGPQKHFLK